MKCTRKKHLIIESRKPQVNDNPDSDDDSTSLSFSERGEITATWRELAGAFLIQLTVSSIGYSYGTIFAFSGEGDFSSDRKSLLVSSVYITCWAFADPWCRKSLSTKKTYNRALTAIGVLIAVGGIACNCAVKNIFLQILGYGIVAGLGTSLVLAQTEELLRCHYPVRHGLVMTFDSVGKALGSSSMPLAACALLAVYGYRGGSLLIAGIVVQGIIGVVLLYPAPILRAGLKATHQRIPRAYTLINNQDNWSSNSQCLSMPQTRHWRNPCRDDLHSSSRKDSGCNGKVDSFKSPTSRRKQPPIIEVMPKILEENEEIDDNIEDQISTSQFTCVVDIENRTIRSDDASQIIETATQNGHGHGNGHDLSVRPDGHNQQSCVVSEESNTSTQEQNSLEEHHLEDDLEEIENDIFTDEEEITIKQSFDTQSFEEILLETCEPCPEIKREESGKECAGTWEGKENPSYKTVPSFNALSLHNQSESTKWYSCCIQQTSKKNANLRGSYNKSPKKPFESLITALKTPYFWPVLLLTSSLKLCPILFASLIPQLSLTRVPHCSLEEATFGVSVAGFSWLCLLVLTPWFNSIAPIKRRYLSSVGCFVAAIGLYLLSGADSRDSVTLGCAVFGIGHGIAVNTAPTLIDETLGPWNLANVATSLGTLSGTIILISTILLYWILASTGGLQYCFITLTVIQAMPGIAWLFRPIICCCSCLCT